MKALKYLGTVLLALFVTTQLTACAPKQCCNTAMNGGYCNTGMHGKGCNKGHRYGPFKGTIKYALSHLDLNEGQWNDVKIAFKGYWETMRSIKPGIPVESLDNGTFNKKVFLQKHPMQQRMLAKAELLETVYLIMNEKQRKKFQMLVGGHQDRMLLMRPAGMGMGCGMGPGKGMCNPKGGNCQGKMCPMKPIQ